ncbi:hypothetical protein B0H63DRAFT_469859 [Podospora didyma]|uniref:RING-type domain-containing protein n=1 Tax=Podospora didyma TaxID=330526 RepID=A0AAE0NTD8_9PEZI|nr:hypothetical protein B0H63DRAFT_469859 [Podospora didyma]
MVGTTLIGDLDSESRRYRSHFSERFTANPGPWIDYRAAHTSATAPVDELTVECICCLDDIEPENAIETGCHKHCKQCFKRLIALAAKSQSQWPLRCCSDPIKFETISKHIGGELLNLCREKEEEFVTSEVRRWVDMINQGGSPRAGEMFRIDRAFEFAKIERFESPRAKQLLKLVVEPKRAWESRFDVSMALPRVTTGPLYNIMGRNKFSETTRGFLNKCGGAVMFQMPPAYEGKGEMREKWPLLNKNLRNNARNKGDPELQSASRRFFDDTVQQPLEMKNGAGKDISTAPYFSLIKELDSFSPICLEAKRLLVKASASLPWKEPDEIQPQQQGRQLNVLPRTHGDQPSALVESPFKNDPGTHQVSPESDVSVRKGPVVYGTERDAIHDAQTAPAGPRPSQKQGQIDTLRSDVEHAISCGQYDPSTTDSWGAWTDQISRLRRAIAPILAIDKRLLFLYLASDIISPVAATPSNGIAPPPDTKHNPWLVGLLGGLAMTSFLTGMAESMLNSDQLPGRIALSLLSYASLGLLTMGYSLAFLTTAVQAGLFAAGAVPVGLLFWILISREQPSAGMAGNNSAAWLRNFNGIGLMAVLAGILNTQSRLIGACMAELGRIRHINFGGDRSIAGDEESGELVPMRPSQDDASAPSADDVEPDV